MEPKKQQIFLQEKFKAGQLSHAYILSGSSIESLETFANDFITFINCKFPDVITVRSADSKSSKNNEKDMMEIAIEQIREVQTFLAYKSYYGGYKSVIVKHAERMSLEAQNCFLKTLEEPKGDTLIFLLAEKPEMLLSTISSRAQLLKLSGEKKVPEESDEVKSLLSVVNSDLAEKFNYVKKANLEGEHFTNVLNGLQRYFRNLLLVKIGAQKGLEHNYSLEKLKKIIGLIEEISRQSAVSNINQKLALEIVLMEI